MQGDIIYSIRENEVQMAGKANAKFLNVFFHGLEGAIAVYWERRERVPADCVRRLYAFNDASDVDTLLC